MFLLILSDLNVGSAVQCSGFYVASDVPVSRSEDTKYKYPLYVMDIHNAFGSSPCVEKVTSCSTFTTCISWVSFLLTNSKSQLNAMCRTTK